MDLNVLETHKTKIIYAVVGAVVVFATLLVTVVASGEEEKLNSQMIEPKPLDSIEQEFHYGEEEAIFFKPSNDSTQSVQNYNK